MKTIRTILKITAGLLAGILLIAVFTGLLLQTKTGKARIAKYASAEVSGLVNGQFTIGRIDGNFFSHLCLSDILLSQGRDTLVYLRQVNLSYDLRALWARRLQFYSITIDSPRLRLVQGNDSVWNFMQLLSPAEEKDTTSSAMPYFELAISRLNLINGVISVSSPDHLIPPTIDSLKIGLSLSYTPDQQSIHVDQFSFRSRKPSFVLRKIELSARRENNLVIVNRLVIQTARNQLLINGKYNTSANEGTLRLVSQPFQLDELSYYTGDFRLQAHPVIDLSSSLQQDSLAATLSLSDSTGKIQLAASSVNFKPYFFTHSDSSLHYRIQSQFTTIDPSRWGGPNRPNYLLNGMLHAQGEGYDPATARLTLSGSLRNSLLEAYPLSRLLLTMQLRNGTITGRLQGKSPMGDFRLRSVLRNLQTVPVYRLQMSTNNVDLGKLTGNQALQSQLNFSATLRGKGLDQDHHEGSALLTLAPSEVAGLHLDTLRSRMHYAGDKLDIDSLYAASPSAQLTIHGRYRLKGRSDLQGKLQLKNTDDLKSYFPTANLHTSGRLTARLTGTTDSLRLRASGRLDRSTYDEWQLDSLRFSLKGTLIPGDTLLRATMTAYRPGNEDFKADSTLFLSDDHNDSIHLSNTLSGPDLSSTLKAQIHLHPHLQVQLSKWKLHYKNQNWDLYRPALLTADSGAYRVHNFRMQSAPSDSAGFLSAAGTIRLSGPEEFTVQVHALDLKNMAILTGQDLTVTGKLSAGLQLRGTARSPVLSGNYNIEKASFNRYQFPEFKGAISYQQNQLDVGTTIVPADSGRLSLNLQLPAALRLDSMNYQPLEDDSLSGELTAKKFPLAILKAFSPVSNVNGLLEGHFQLRGTLKNPKPTGNLSLTDAQVQVPTYGIDYKSIGMSLSVTPGQVKLDTLFIKSEDGHLSGRGTVDLDSTLYNGQVKQSEIQLNFDRFNPVNHKQFNLQVSGQTSIYDQGGNVRFDGNLNIPQSKVYLPAVFNLMGKMSESSIPPSILAQKLEQMQQDSVSPSPGQQATLPVQLATPALFKKVTGRIKIKLPRNSWIKDDNMHMELSGDLEIVKHPESSELFGTIDVVRGQYDLLGKTFIIDDGSTISFQGGEDMMPTLNLAASSTFRNSDKAEQTLAVSITGKATSPRIQFTLDDESIEEGDALSYILFGKSMDELSLNQQENVSSTGSIAESAAASLLSSQLTNYIGKKINLDYIEVKSQGGFNNASVTLGKYITNKLFVSYEQQIGQNSTTTADDASSYEVKLEYELFRFLFFQLNNSSEDSGFDLIYKFHSK